MYVCVCEWSEKSALGLITTQLFSNLLCLSTPLTNSSAWALLSLCTATELQSIDEYTLASACITCTTTIKSVLKVVNIHSSVVHQNVGQPSVLLPL